MVQLACGGDATSSDGATDVGEGNPSANAAPSTPSQDLTGAQVGTGGSDTVNAQTGASTAFGSTKTNVPVAGTPADPVVDPSTDPGIDPGADPVTPPVTPGPSNPGPKPPTCSVSKDSAGFFVRTTSKSNYVAYVPASYNGSAPMRLIVGMHGCGDSAANFASWAVNPYATRGTQQHIGISIGGQDGNCWSSGDDEKVLAAIDDIASCFWVHQKKVSLAGFSSGGRVAYRVGLKNASRFASILIEDSAMPNDGTADALLANATRKIPIAHRTHTADTVFPLAAARTEWAKIRAAGFPLLTSETGGGHDGVSEDWSNWLIPQSASWMAP